jgi:imidazolonepropionase-like amidohydrolase
MESYIFENARILDGSSDEGEHDRFVRVAGNLIEEVSDRPIKDQHAKYIDLRGKTLMPGLIDCHVHINQTGSHDPTVCSKMPSEVVAYHSAKAMKGMLNRGFTTIRDLGGATFGQVQAVEQGLVEGPRLVICGKAFVQTGGHVDVRSRYDLDDGAYQLTNLGACARVVDGVDECRRAARDEIRKGARYLKIMAGGGAASLHFPRPYLAFSMDELRAFE